MDRILPDRRVHSNAARPVVGIEAETVTNRISRERWTPLTSLSLCEILRAFESLT
jgi:hypothetical protein